MVVSHPGDIEFVRQYSAAPLIASSPRLRLRFVIISVAEVALDRSGTHRKVVETTGLADRHPDVLERVTVLLDNADDVPKSFVQKQVSIRQPSR